MKNPQTIHTHKDRTGSFFFKFSLKTKKYSFYLLSHRWLLCTVYAKVSVLYNEVLMASVYILVEM